MSTYAHDADINPILLLDNTVFGNASDGLYLTEDTIFIKTVLTDRLKEQITNIGSIYFNEKDGTLAVNYYKLKIITESTYGKIKIIINEINEHISSLGVTTNAQTGRIQHLKNLIQQLEALYFNTEQWGTSFIERYAKCYDHINSGSYLGFEGFFEKAAIKLGRSNAKTTYVDLRKELDEKISSMNGFTIISHANKELEEDEFSPIIFEFEFKCHFDSNSSLSNEDWEGNNTEALDELLRVEKEFLQKIQSGLENLKKILEDESD